MNKEAEAGAGDGARPSGNLKVSQEEGAGVWKVPLVCAWIGSFKLV